MVHCTVQGCKNYTNKKTKIPTVKYFTFPRDNNTSKSWVRACGSDKNINVESARICSDHFTDADYTLKDQLVNTPFGKRRLKQDAVPTKNLPISILHSRRASKAAIQARKELVQAAFEEYEKGISAKNNQKTRETTKIRQEPMNTEFFETVFIPETIQEEPENIKDESVNSIQEETVNSGQKETVSSILTKTVKSIPEEIVKKRPIILLKIVPNELPKQATPSRGSEVAEFDREHRIMALERELIEAKLEIKKLKNRMSKADVLYLSLKQTLTEGQIRKLENPEKRIIWSRADVSSAYCLYTAGPRAYRQLFRKNFPLPEIMILKKWAAKNTFVTGMLHSVLTNMESSPYDDKQRLCVLCFDEVKLSSTDEPDLANGETQIQPKYAEIIMARSLLEQWSYPIYYDYDKRISLAILNDVIHHLENIQYTVVAIVSDMRITRHSLWKELGIDSTEPWIPNPVRNEEKVFIFADVLHLGRALRSHFVYTGFKINNRIISIAPLQELNQPGLLYDLGLIWKSTNINEEPIFVKNPRRQDINHAMKLFSTSLTNAIRDSIQKNRITNENVTECCAFIQTIAEWLGVFTSKTTNYENDERKMPFGYALNTQLRILENMNNLMLDIRTNNKFMLKKGYEYPFQKGVRKCNAALPQFFEYMKERYGIEAIATSNLSQDVLDVFVQTKLQAKGNRYDCVTPDEFKSSLESYIVGGK